ncbi:hypothetical protein QFC22_006105 [Naganishia vaughanmartiniae]|uniref:Uncharacterized protein n=1 Tax=Naganishia vaughanmartiniae TaxID=1424756 RepID=A0ACC2WPC5_9TREE|nr:hypothetical protein QFC22_006105 [Naganishia vaughanmartiniae]
MFSANPSYSYPHFNTYRLAAQPLRATSHPLPPAHYAGFPSGGGGDAGQRVLGWKEAKARASWEALKQGRADNEVLFVDQEGKVVSVRFEQGRQSITPIYTTIASLTLPTTTDTAKPTEYPSVLGVKHTEYILASAGDAHVHLIQGENSGTATVQEYTVRWPKAQPEKSVTGMDVDDAEGQEETEEYPLLLQAVQPVYATSPTSGSGVTMTCAREGDGKIVVGCNLVISRTIRIENDPTSSAAPSGVASTSTTTPQTPAAAAGKKHDIQFQLAGVFMPFPSASAPPSSSPSSTGGETDPHLNIQWCAQAGEAATYVRWLAPAAGGNDEERAGKGGNGADDGVAAAQGKWLIGGNERFTVFPPSAGGGGGGGRDPESSLTQNIASGSVLGQGMVAMRDDDPMVQQSSGREGAEQYPYSWTQTRESVTAVFELAFYSADSTTSTTTTTTTTTTTATTSADAEAGFNPHRDVLVHFSPSSLDLRFPDRPAGKESVRWTAAQRMFFSVLDVQAGKRDWWDTIDKDGSTWTFEWMSSKAGEERKARLVFELQKANEGVRWAAVFAPLQDTRRDAYIEEMQEEEDDDDDGMTVQEMDIDVPETLTQEQIDASRAGLEQYHVAGPEGSVPPANRFAGLGAIPPSMMGEPMDDDLVEFDDDPAFSGHVGGEPTVGGASGSEGQGKVGTLMIFTQVSPAGSGKQSVRWDVASAQTEGVWVLSTELGNDDPSVILKSHLDGQLFVPPRCFNSSAWTHKSTNPALSFVLASKRDTQYVHHLYPSSTATGETQGATVIAFEARQVNGMGGNAYVYWPISDTGKTKSGKNAAEEGSQAVVKFGEADGGVLLGVSRVVSGGQVVVVGLCERQLVVLQGL